MLCSVRTLRRASLVGAALILAVGPSIASAQAAVDPRLPGATTRMKLAGPRFGITFLSAGIVDKLAARSIDAAPVITQFGWQFERQFLGAGEGTAPVTEFVILVGGLEQGLFLPSATWLVGLRSVKGTEFGIGPNITPAGIALAIAVGTTLRRESVNIPINVALVPSASGVRLSVLTGWTMR